MESVFPASEIVNGRRNPVADLATADPKALSPPQVLARAGDIAAEALAAAATYGRLPPFSQAGETRDDAANSNAPASPRRWFEMRDRGE